MRTGKISLNRRIRNGVICELSSLFLLFLKEEIYHRKNSCVDWIWVVAEDLSTCLREGWLQETDSKNFHSVGGNNVDDC